MHLSQGRRVPTLTTVKSADMVNGHMYSRAGLNKLYSSVRRAASVGGVA